MKRDDLIHPLISGNKWRKLQGQKINIDQSTLITFGGAFSNHLVAVAYLAHKLQRRSIGFVRSDNIDKDNPTLQICQAFNMQLIPLNREEYKEKQQSQTVQNYLHSLQENYYLIPEGGTNQYSSIGFKNLLLEIQQQLGKEPDAICCAYGTGGTSKGFAQHKQNKTTLYINPVIKGLTSEQILSELSREKNEVSNVSILPIYDNLRYAKINDNIMRTVDTFLEEHEILLDPIYTARLIASLQKTEYLSEKPEHKTIVIYHSGGIQGWGGVFYRKPSLKSQFPRIYNAYKMYFDIV